MKQQSRETWVSGFALMLTFKVFRFIRDMRASVFESQLRAVAIYALQLQVIRIGPQGQQRVMIWLLSTRY
jgi:hypothetical protein